MAKEIDLGGVKLKQGRCGMRKISRNPQKISENCWYYENKRYIDLVYEIHSDGCYIRTDIIRIPKYKLKRSLKRMEAI